MWLQVCSALLLAFGDAAQAGGPVVLRVVSPNGRFAAEAIPREPGLEQKSGEVRCDLAIFEVRQGGERVPQWKGLYDYRGSEDGHLLCDDGSAFVHVDARSADSRPLVRVIRKGLVLAALDARALRLGPISVGSVGSAGTAGSVATWIDLAPETCRLRNVASVTNTSRYLDLLGRDSILRTLDLSSGDLAVGTALEISGPPSVELPLAAASHPDFAPPFVQSISVPPFVSAGEALAVDVKGSFATPGWELQGFDLSIDAQNPNRLVLTPLAKPPSGVVAQVLRPFRAIAKIVGLHVGTYTISVRGHDNAQPVADESVDVLPPGLSVMLKQKSERAPRVIALLADGRSLQIADRPESTRIVLAPVEAQQDIETRVRALDPRAASSAKTAAGAVELTWIAAGQPVRVRRAENELDAPWRELAAKLVELARPASRRYAIDAAASRIQVHTFSGGLLAAFGHDHTLAPRQLEGFVELVPGDLEHARVEISVRADSIEVIDKESQGDRVEIEKEMRDNVLETARFPTIRFQSKRIAIKPLGPRTHEVTITGELELHGQKREITVQGRIGLEEGEFQARGAFVVRQSDYGIRRTSAAAGTIKVDDEVKLEFDLRARPPR